MHQGRRILQGRLCWVLGLAFLFFFFSLSSNTYAHPEQGQIVAGNAHIHLHADNPNHTIIHQTTPKAIIDWNSFNIAQHEITEFKQPTTEAIMVNRVTGSDPSRILGQMKANGNVWLLNPAGILFGKTAHVDVAGLLATTADIKNEDFMAGHYHFKQAQGNHSAIVNEGHISIKEGGLAFFVAPGFRNSGLIEGKMSKIRVGSGTEFIVDFYGDGLINFSTAVEDVKSLPQDIDGNVLTHAIHNTESGELNAEGGSIIFSTQPKLFSTNQAKEVLENLINMDGIVRANAAREGQNGEIILSGGGEGIVMVASKAKLEASGKRPKEKGGTIKVLGEKVGIVDGAKIDVAGDAGGGTILFGGDNRKGSLIKTSDYTFVGQNTHFSADALTSGDAGKMFFLANKNLQFYSNHILAKGGQEGGNGGLVEVSCSKGDMKYSPDGSRWNLSAPRGRGGKLIIDPRNITVINGGANYDPGVNNLFNNFQGLTVPIDPNTFPAAADILLQANTNITIVSPVDPGIAIQSFQAQAGGSIFVQNRIITGGGNILLSANDNAAIVADRDPLVAASISFSTTSPIVLNPNGGQTTLQVQTLGLAANPAITQTVPVQIPDQVIFNTGAQDIALTNPANTIATGGGSDITIVAANNVSLVNNTFTVFNNVNMTGNLSVNAQGFSITQTGGTAMVVAGTSQFSTAANVITLNQPNNAFTGAVSFNNTGANDVTIVNNVPLILGTSTIGQNLIAAANGSITQTGTITAGGNLQFTLNAANADILLPLANNVTGGITAINNPANLRDLSFRNVNAAGNVVPNLSTFPNLRNLTLVFDNAGFGFPNGATLHNGGNLIVSVGGALTQAAPLIVPGFSSLTSTNNSIILNDAGNQFIGTVFLNAAANATLTNSVPLTLSTSTVGGNLTLTTTAGNSITEIGTIIVGGNETLNSGGSIFLAANSSVGGFLMATAAGSISESGTLTVGGSETLVAGGSITLGTSTIGGNLNATAGNLINEVGPVTVNGTSTFTLNSPGQILLNTQPNNFVGPLVFGNPANIQTLGIRNVNSNASMANISPTLNTNLALTYPNLQNLSIIFDNSTIVVNSLQFPGSLMLGGFNAVNSPNNPISVGSLSLSLFLANLWGSVGGATGIDAALRVIVLNQILPGHVFFNGFDLFFRGVFSLYRLPPRINYFEFLPTFYLNVPDVWAPMYPDDLPDFAPYLAAPRYYLGRINLGREKKLISMMEIPLCDIDREIQSVLNIDMRRYTIQYRYGQLLY